MKSIILKFYRFSIPKNQSHLKFIHFRKILLHFDAATKCISSLPHRIIHVHIYILMIFCAIDSFHTLIAHFFSKFFFGPGWGRCGQANKHKSHSVHWAFFARKIATTKKLFQHILTQNQWFR